MARKTIKQLEAKIEHLEAVIQGHVEYAAVAKVEAEREIGYETLQRMAAQRGLVVYVRGLEAFDSWLKMHENLRNYLEPTLRHLGLWEIKLGYDPDQDPALSVVSPTGPLARSGALKGAKWT